MFSHACLAKYFVFRFGSAALVAGSSREVYAHPTAPSRQREVFCPSGVNPDSSRPQTRAKSFSLTMTTSNRQRRNYNFTVVVKDNSLK